MELIKKITAPNPGVFTGGGTNTYLIGKEDLTLIDPGPNIKEHIDEIIRAGKNKIKRMVDGMDCSQVMRVMKTIRTNIWN